MRHYPFSEIEAKWQRRWEEQGLFDCPTDADNRFYCLVMYPYPSGDLHVGHGRNYIIGDAVTRYKIMRGKSVLSPMGWTRSACRPRTARSSAGSTRPYGPIRTSPR
jgi:leucyl-tRNA synthetase